MSSSPPDHPSLKEGRYTLLGSLGAGTQGHTFDGVDRREGRAVAIKRFDVRAAKTWKDAELAERETRVLQSLSHRRLPKYFDHFEEDGALYLVMEKIDGESLAALRKRGAVLSERDVVRLLRDASEVLDYLHGRARPVIHRDLKPGNVIRRPDGTFAFVDFGAVRDKLRPEGGSTVVGTFGFMAPEQFQGRALPASDVYAIGATAVSMLTGEEPQDLPHKGLALDVRAALGRRVDARLVDALEAMLDPDPDRRPSRIAPLLERLESPERPEPRARASGRHGNHPNDANDPPLTRREMRRQRLRQSFIRHLEDYEARAQDYERRASSGGPGARGFLQGAAQWRKAAQQMRASLERESEKFERRAAKEARRQGQRFERWVDRSARRDRGSGMHGSPERFPMPLRLFFAFTFLVGIVAVQLAMQVVVPTLLVVLSTFFARRALTGAARRVREAGHEAVREMDQSRRWFLGGDAAPEAAGARGARDAKRPDPRVRLADEPGARDPRIRVEPGERGVGDEDAADADDLRADEGAKRR